MVKNEHGFTLPELMVAIAIILCMTIGAAVLLRPASFKHTNQDAERRIELSVLAVALKKYKLKHGDFPAGIGSTRMAISVADKSFDACSVLVPEFIKDIPLDPTTGVRYSNGVKQDQAKGDPCNLAGAAYVAGYTVQRNTDGSLLLVAPAASEAVEVTIR